MDNDPSFFAGKGGAILIAMGSASFVVTIYHLIILCRNQTHLTIQISEQQQTRSAPQVQARGSMEQNILVRHLIPAHKYKKKKKNDDDVADGDEDEDDDDTCAVCLGDFEEGQELRTLPECMHSFHVPCIDTWLCSHSNCLVCRTHATTTSPAVVHRSPEYGSGQFHTVDIAQIGLAQNRLALGEILR